MIKKSIIFIIILQILVSFYNTSHTISAQETSSDIYEYRYETCGRGTSREEAALVNQQILSQLPYVVSSNDPESGDEAFLPNQYNVVQHLNDLYPNYIWAMDNSVSITVSNTYKGNPENMYSGKDYISDACNISEDDEDPIGCGVLSMISQMEYLARCAGYVNLISNPSVNKEMRDFTLEVISTVPAIGGGEDEDGDSQTLVLPYDFLDSGREILENHNLTFPIINISTGLGGEIIEDIFYDDRSQIIINGDIIVNNLATTTNINNIKDSIDRGMPVIMCTSAFPGEFYYHYFNIYGYQTFVGTDANGNTIEHLMFNIHMNWGGMYNHYMDSRLLSNFGYWLFYFEEVHERTTVRHNNYDEDQGIYTPFVGGNFTARHSQTAPQDISVTIIDDKNTEVATDDTISIINREMTVFSPLSSSAGTAYFEYQFAIPIRRMYIELNWLSTQEIPLDYDMTISLQYKNGSGVWTTMYDVLDTEVAQLSSDVAAPSKIDLDIPIASSNIRVFMQASGFSVNEDSGKIAIQNAMFILNEHDYKFNYVYVNDTSHTVECMCGNIITEQHSYSYTYYDEDYHIKACACGQSTYAPHNWVLTRLRSGVASPNYVIIYECSYCKTISMGPVQNI